MNDTEIIPVPTENKSDSETNEQIIESSTEPNIDDSVVIENNEETSEDLATDIPPSYRGIGYFFRRILSFVLSSATILTVGITFFSAAQSIEINKTTLTRQLIGEFVGGMKNVYAEEPRNSYPLLSPPPPDGLEMIEKIPMPEDLAENQMPSDGSSPLILARDLSSTAEGSLGIINETPYTPDLEKLLSAKRVIPYADSLYDLYGEKKPVVLILHTHATEAFADQFAGGFRSNDTTKNIVSVFFSYLM